MGEAFMRKMMSATAAAVAGGATSAGAAVAVNGPSNCPSGHVCIFAVDGDNPIDKFYTYGAHNLSGKVGFYYVTNNQTDGATATLCYGYGVQCFGGTLTPGFAYAGPDADQLDPSQPAVTGRRV
jgi:hypothetical protein